MSQLFSEHIPDEDVKFKTNNEYAKNYNNWRQKEEYNKLKTKYGETSMDSNEDDSSSSDDDDDVQVSKQLEVDFFKTLSSLKTKDPKIYDADIKFFDDVPVDLKQPKKKKEEQIFLKDYERKLLLEKGGIVSDDEDDEDNPRARSPTYIEEQRNLKLKLRSAIEDIEDDNENEWGGMFKVRQKTEEEKEREESEYKKWLMGDKKHLDDETTEKDLKPLKDYWSNPKLEAGEKFLRDYILNERFLDKANSDYIPSYEEIVHDSDENLSEDEAQIDKQEDFEYKYNYRYEEPDQDFIKRYPRTMEQSLRRPDDKRSIKRAEVKDRKLQEKQQKFEDIKQLKEMKKKEIAQKIEQLKEITGNTNVAFENEDLDDDFDPDAHDARMQKLFNEEFYDVDEDGDRKPEFPEWDEELEIERWDKYQPENDEGELKSDEAQNPHCEDDQFNMDCDYDPSQTTQQELIENSRGKKKKKKKSNFAQAASVPKPTYNATNSTYEEYLDEYYKMDCEDIIGDIPCRFKYRTVVPNSFGLTVEEILTAKDRELNKWCSLKKAVQHRPEHVEKYDVIAFKNKGANEYLKKKIIPSLFEPDTQENSQNDENPDNSEENDLSSEIKVEKIEDTSSESLSTKTKIKKKGKSSTETKSDSIVGKTNENVGESSKNNDTEESSDSSGKKKKKKSSKCTGKLDISTTVKESNLEVTKASVVKAEKSNKKKKNSNKEVSKPEVSRIVKNRKRKHGNDKEVAVDNKKKKFEKKRETESSISDARLKAFGLNPKKYKNKLKYGSK